MYTSDQVGNEPGQMGVLTDEASWVKGETYFKLESKVQFCFYLIAFGAELTAQIYIFTEVIFHTCHLLTCH